MQRAVNIVCFDIPYPANYGGAIDVFHKVRWLHAKGVEIYLHCFEYGGRRPAKELEQYCAKVHYYKRRTGIGSLLSSLPYNVKSRQSGSLLQNLLSNQAPVICEVLHTCALLTDPRFANRLKIYREVNIEHDYYRHLAQGEKSLLKKLYLYTEARKLKRFEKILKQADKIAAVSVTDEAYFHQAYPSIPTALLPCFHEFDEVRIKEGKSDYILYHGNLGVSENYAAADWLIDHVFSKVTYKVVIAGLNPPDFLRQKIAKYRHIELRENCTVEEMNGLVENAQVHCLYTAQATGLKLKLLNVLYRGRHVVANNGMLSGTSLARACRVANSPSEYIGTIHSLMAQEFTVQHAGERKELVSDYDNSTKIATLLKMLEE